MVTSDEEERFPLLPWGEKTEMRGGPSLKGKGGLVGFRKTLKVKEALVVFRKKQRASNPLANPWVKAGSSPHKKTQLCCWRRPLMVRQPYSEAVWAPSRAVGTSPVPWGERGLGKAVDPPLRVREDWWVFEDLLRFQGSTCSFSKVQETTFIFSNVKKVLVGFQKTLLMPREVFRKPFLSPISYKK